VHALTNAPVSLKYPDVLRREVHARANSPVSVVGDPDVQRQAVQALAYLPVPVGDPDVQRVAVEALANSPISVGKPDMKLPEMHGANGVYSVKPGFEIAPKVSFSTKENLEMLQYLFTDNNYMDTKGDVIWKKFGCERSVPSLRSRARKLAKIVASTLKNVYKLSLDQIKKLKQTYENVIKRK